MADIWPICPPHPPVGIRYQTHLVHMLPPLVYMHICTHNTYTHMHMYMCMHMHMHMCMHMCMHMFTCSHVHMPPAKILCGEHLLAVSLARVALPCWLQDATERKALLGTATVRIWLLGVGVGVGVAVRGVMGKGCHAVSLRRRFRVGLGLGLGYSHST